MPIETEPYTLYERGWIVRVRPPLGPASGRAALLIHGWTGNETVMWIFARALPPDLWVFAPRGPVTAPGGYGWTAVRGATLAQYADYTTPAAALIEQVDYWLRSNRLPPAPLDVMGFSQGAALAYTLLADFPDRIARLAALAGYLPAGASQHLDPLRLTGKPVFIAHGATDQTIPVQAARDSAAVIGAAGADVRYCEDPVGHKLGAGCLKELQAFFTP